MLCMARTVRQLQAAGVTPRHERGPAAKLAYFLQMSTERFNLLPWVLEARLCNLRTANVRMRRRFGLGKIRAKASYKIGACNAAKTVVECSHAGARDAAANNGRPITANAKGTGTMDNSTNGTDNGTQVCTFYKDHKGIYSSFRLPGTRGSVNITNKMFVGGVVPQTIVVSGLVPANSEAPVGDADKAAEKAAKAQAKAEAAQAKAAQRAEKLTAAADKAKAQAAAALERANKAKAAATAVPEPAVEGEAAEQAAEQM